MDRFKTIQALRVGFKVANQGMQKPVSVVCGVSALPPGVDAERQKNA